MDTTQSVALTPWTKRGLGYIFTFKMVPIPEDMSLCDPETNEPNREAFDELIPSLLVSRPIVQVIFHKENDGSIKINDLYQCILKGYQETSDIPDVNESMGLVLDALKSMGAASKHAASNAPAGLPPILHSFFSHIIDEGSLAIGSVVTIQHHLCFLRLEKTLALFLPSAETKLSKQDSKA